MYSESRIEHIMDVEHRVCPCQEDALQNIQFEYNNRLSVRRQKYKFSYSVYVQPLVCVLLSCKLGKEAELLLVSDSSDILIYLYRSTIYTWNCCSCKTILIEHIVKKSRLTVVSREAKKKQHACASSGPRDHYSELFTRMAALKF